MQADDFHKVMEHAFKDPAYASKLQHQTEEALRELHVHPTPEKVRAIQATFPSLRAAYATFGGVDPD